jgi:hypothetical protein
VKKEYIITRQGKDFVLYEGLLDEAHRQGLKRISTTLIQIPHEDNGNVAVVQAEVETDKGMFSGIGDASPHNVKKADIPNYLAVAEVRAKARALRDAINTGMAPAEDLGDERDGSADVRERAGNTARESAETYRAEAPKGPVQKPASANQLATIAKLSRLLGHPEQPDETITSAEASERITELSREYNERKGSARRSA